MYPLIVAFVLALSADYNYWYHHAPMVKKNKKNRFTQDIDVNVVYAPSTKASADPSNTAGALEISAEKAAEVQRIRASIPTQFQGPSIESELAKIPDREPFRAFVHNVAFTATADDVAEFFAPLIPTNVNMVHGESVSRGFCFVDFASRDDLAKALSRTDSQLAGRPVSVRIAIPGGSNRSTQNRDRSDNWNRDRSDNWSRGGDYRSGGGNRRGSYCPPGLRGDFETLSAMGRGSPNASADSWQRGTAIPAAAARQSSSSNAWIPSRGSRGGGNDGPRPRVSNPLPPGGGEVRRNPNIFGDALPVDTASKEKEIAARLAGLRTAE